MQTVFIKTFPPLNFLFLVLLSCFVNFTVAVNVFAEDKKIVENSKIEKNLDDELAAYLPLFQALPEVAKYSDGTVPSNAKIKLGKALHLETKLSLNNKISCNSCHNLKTFGVDNLAKSPGHVGQLGGRNSPTSFNAALHMAQFWDGRAADVEAQALGPILNPKEMAMPNEEEVVNRLSKDKNYITMFKEAFPNDKNSLTYVNVGKAIGAFERTLLTPSKFDEYLNGNKKALTEKQKQGFKTFAQVGCVACHSGVLLGGQSYQKLGLVKPYKNSTPEDHGRMDLTKQPVDDMMFKVPSLRNITKTAPYFHDGSIKSLNEAVNVMAEYQLGKNLEDKEVVSIIEFLGSLEGDI